MDHRVSKDMISNGMTPSGEKSQEDLGRTQYGSTPSPNSLFDAYKSIYEHHKKDADGNTIPHEGEELNEAIPLIGAALAGAGKLVAGLGAKAAATGAGKAIAGAAAKKGLGAAAKKGTMMVGKKLGGTQGARIGAKAADAFGKMDNFSKLQTVSMAKDTVGSTLNAVNPLKKRVGGTGGGGGVTGGMSQTVSAGADLFDIVKGQLLDEGLSEEEIKDIMLTLTPDEIMKEMNQGPSTPVKNYGDSPDKPKILPNFGATRAKPRTTDKGTLIKGGKDTGKTPAQMSQEEYKNFDPKKPDPKQMAAQAKQEKIRQKNSDPMGVKNRNIGGQGLDPMDK